jgi:membrane-associated protease RseP (regulator of RpoE activity)
MTDETPQPEGTPSPATPEEQPTAETKPFTYDDAVAQTGEQPPAAAAAEAPTQAAPATGYAAPTPAAAPVTTADRPAGIFIPKWLGIVVGLIVAALVFGGIGYAIGDSSSDSGSTQNAANAVPNDGNGNGGQTFPGGGQFPGPGNFPNGNGNQGNGNGSGNQGNGGTSANAGFLGVGVQTTSDDKGVEISEVQDGSAAAKAGLQQGDVITAIDGKDVTSPQAVRSAVQAKHSGDTISVTYTRDGQSKTVDVTLTSRSQAQSS